MSSCGFRALALSTFVACIMRDFAGLRSWQQTIADSESKRSCLLSPVQQRSVFAFIIQSLELLFTHKLPEVSEAR